MALRDIHSLWIGDRLGPMEELCLCSFIKHGHKVFLHSYKSIAVPSGVSLLDANLLIPENQIIRFRRKGSVALFANRFRYEILRHFDAYWADADLYCLRPFEFDSPYLFGIDRMAGSRPILNNAVLGAPSDSAFLTQLLALFANPSLAFRFLTQKEIMKTRWIALKQLRRVGLEDFPWGSAGPIAVTNIAEELGLMTFAKPVQTFYALKGTKLFEAGHRWEDAVEMGTYSAHFTHSKLQRRPVDLMKPEPGSFYDYCVRDTGGMTNYF